MTDPSLRSKSDANRVKPAEPTLRGIAGTPRDAADSSVVGSVGAAPAPPTASQPTKVLFDAARPQGKRHQLELVTELDDHPFVVEGQIGEETHKRIQIAVDAQSRRAWAAAISATVDPRLLGRRPRWGRRFGIAAVLLFVAAASGWLIKQAGLKSQRSASANHSTTAAPFVPSWPEAVRATPAPLPTEANREAPPASATEAVRATPPLLDEHGQQREGAAAEPVATAPNAAENPSRSAVGGASSTKRPVRVPAAKPPHRAPSDQSIFTEPPF